MPVPAKLTLPLAIMLTAPFAIAAFLAATSFHQKQVPVGVRRNLWQDGVLARGESRRHQTVLYNTTDHPVHIAHFVVTPGATLAFEKRDIPAHGEVSVFFGAKPDSKGKNWLCGSDIYLDGYLDPITLKAYGSIIDLAPAVVDAGEIYLAKEKLLSFPLQSRNGNALRVYRAVYDAKRLEVKVAAGKLGSEAQIRVLPIDTPGKFAATVTLTTDDKLFPEVTTQIVGRCLPHVVASPDILSLGVFSSLEQAEATISLRSPYGKPFTVRRVTIVPAEALQVIGPPHPVADGYALRVALKNGTAGISLDARVFIEIVVDGSRKPETVNIPVYGLYLPLQKEAIRAPATLSFGASPNNP